MSDGGKAAVQADDQVVGAGEVRALKKRRRDLKRMLGKKTMDVEILQEAQKIVREKKNNCSRAVWLTAPVHNSKGASLPPFETAAQSSVSHFRA